MGDMRSLGLVVIAVSLLLACERPAAQPAVLQDPPRTAPTEREASARAPEIGGPAPAFTLRDVDGAPVGLVPGKVNVLMFWATWSEPDKKAMPHMQSMFERLGPRGLTVLGISMDHDGLQLAEAARSWGARFPIAWDAKRTALDLYQPPSTPVFFIVDRGGVLRFIHVGFHPGEEKALGQEIESLL